MKIDARRIDGFLANPSPARVVLFHGEDEGLIREYATRLVRSVAGALDDPFRVSEVERDAYGTLPDEVAALSMTGGRRVVRVRDATDGASAAVQKVLAGNGPGLLVMEGPTLTSKSKLKTLVERSDVAATVACYPMDASAITQLARGVLAEDRIQIDADALVWLSGQLGADRLVTRSELEKLALHAGPGGVVDMEVARACIGDLSGLSQEDALFAATDGDVAGCDRALELAMAEGATPVGLLRAGLMHLQRFTRARASVDGGASAEEAVRGLRPPLFFKRVPVFTRSLRLWSASALELGTQRLSDTERACKRTGSPAEVLCRNALVGLAMRAAVAKRR